PRYAPLQLRPQQVQPESQLSLIRQLEVQTRSAAVSNQSSHRAVRDRRMRTSPVAGRREAEHLRTGPISRHSVGRTLTLPGYTARASSFQAQFRQTIFTSTEQRFCNWICAFLLEFARVD